MALEKEKEEEQEQEQEEEEEEEEEDLSSLRVSDLKERLEQLGLATGGKKAELIERLVSATTSASAEEQEEAEEEEEEDLSALRAVDLKDRLQELGPKTDGKKAALLKRLQTAVGDRPALKVVN